MVKPVTRLARIGLFILVAVMLGQLWLVVLFRAFRRNRAALLRYDAFRRVLKTYNAMTRRLAGTPRSTVGLLTHVGRRSGRSYYTSLGVADHRHGFLVPLTYGPGTDWFRNLQARGGTLAWKGRHYQVERPEIVSGREPMQAWPIRSRIMLQAARIDEFAWLHVARREG